MAAVTFKEQIIYPALAAASLISALSATPVLAGSRHPVSNREIELAREYVLAACIINKYHGTALADEAEIWAGGLVEKGTIPGETYGTLATIAQKDAPQPLLSRSGKLMLMESCVNLYNSKALIKKISKVIQINRKP